MKRLRLRLVINQQRLQISDAFIILAWCSSVSTWSFDIVFARMDILRENMDFLLSEFTGDMKTLQTAQLVHNHNSFLSHKKINRLTNLKYSWVSNFTFFTTLYMCKAAILSFYLQIFPTLMYSCRRVLWIVIAYTSIGFIVSLSLNAFLCLPIRRNWYIARSLS